MSRLPLLGALGLIAVPNFIFLATHLASSLLAVLCCSLAAAACGFVIRDIGTNRDAVDWPLLGICFAAAFSLCLLGGETHVFYPNPDWLIRDAVLSDLVKNPWPLGYLYQGDRTFLRAPLGLYLSPALIGKAFGLVAAHVALLVQNSVLFGCLFYCFTSAFPSRRRALWTLSVFILYCGWDIIGQLLLHGVPTFGQHLQHWQGELQYSSHVTQVFWVPNHAASGWAFVAAYLFWRRDRLSATSLVVVFGFCNFWSPLSMIGALPFLGLAVVSDVRRGRIATSGMVTSILAALALTPIALYLIADSGRVPHGEQALEPDFIYKYVAFLTFDLLPALFLLRLFRPVPAGSFLRSDVPVVIAVLLICPLFRIGGNDFVMRASIPALAILAFCVADRVWFVLGDRKTRPIVEAMIVLAIGAVTPFYEIVRAVRTPTYPISDCNIMTASSFPPNTGPMVHYVARIEALRPLDRVLKMPTAALSVEPRTSCSNG